MGTQQEAPILITVVFHPKMQFLGRREVSGMETDIIKCIVWANFTKRVENDFEQWYLKMLNQPNWSQRASD